MGARRTARPEIEPAPAGGLPGLFDRNGDWGLGGIARSDGGRIAANGSRRCEAAHRFMKKLLPSAGVMPARRRRINLVHQTA
jgi:hypothetical protein